MTNTAKVHFFTILSNFIFKRGSSFVSFIFFTLSSTLIYDYCMIIMFDPLSFDQISTYNRFLTLISLSPLSSLLFCPSQRPSKHSIKPIQSYPLLLLTLSMDTLSHLFAMITFVILYTTLSWTCKSHFYFIMLSLWTVQKQHFPELPKFYYHLRKW